MGRTTWSPRPIMGLLASLPLFTGAGCFAPGPPVFGPEANPERVKRQIPIIPGNWFCSSNLGTLVRWVNPLFRKSGYKNNPCHASKTTELHPDGVPQSEVDLYYSGKEIHGHVDGPIAERMEISYDFDSARAGGSPWNCLVIDGLIPRECSLDEAESLLKKWGLSRLNDRDEGNTKGKGSASNDRETADPGKDP